MHEYTATEVRKTIAGALRVPVDLLKCYSLFLRDYRCPGSLELWTESEPLPLDFFQPRVVPTRGYCCRHSARYPSLKLHCIHKPSLLEAAADDDAIAFLASEEALERLRLGEFPLNGQGLSKVAATALLLKCGE